MPEKVLTFAEARAVVEEHARALTPSAKEVVDLAAATERVLAEDVAADRDYPPFRRATRDGYAVRAADLSQLPTALRNIAQIKAGDEFHATVNPGECAEIMTGAAVPKGADAVVMVEFTQAQGDQIRVERYVTSGENVVPSGAEGRRGDAVLRRGTRIGPPEIAVMATVGITSVPVYKRPRVAILSTGDEVVELNATPGPVQIRNSNAHSLAAQVRRAGADPIVLPIARDEKVGLRKLIAEGLQADMLLLSGGVSMGKYDLVEQVLEEFGAEFIFTGVKIQPGKPLVLGRAKQKYFFGLPGNPVSTMVTFQLFAQVIVDALAGASPRPLPFTQATLDSEIKTKTGLTRFLPAKLAPSLTGTKVKLVPWHGSGDVFAQAKADCLLVVPPDRERIAAGEQVTVLPF
jgi:molybdopterin molybdotransferase